MRGRGRRQEYDDSEFGDAQPPRGKRRQPEMSTANGVVHTDTQFSVFLVNKPGILAQICQRLADSKVNLVAMSMMDSTEHGVLRLVAESAQEARAALANIEVPTTETTVLTVSLPPRPGALA